MRRIASVVIVTLLAGCSSAPEDGSVGRAPPRPTTAPSPTEGAERAASSDRRRDPDDRRATSGSSPERSTSRGSAAEPPGDAAPEVVAAPTEAPDQSRPGSSSAMAAPAGGRYLYAQSGWEEFCAPACRRSDLPPSATVDVRVARVDRGTVEVVARSSPSEERTMRTTSYVSTSAVDIAEVELRYGPFSNVYRPAPPVTSLKFPLRVGDTWTSAWRADVSGEFSGRVLGVERLTVGGRAIKTFKVDTVTTMRGDFRGTMTVTLWVDPDTTTSVRTRGKARIETGYGRFRSNFDTMLIDGPRYRDR